jgi:osmotically-inducible protein OsmY
MADNNFNRRDRSNYSQQNRGQGDNRNEWNMENENSFGNAGFEDDHQQRGQGYGYNNDMNQNVHYIPDNNDNRNEYRNYDQNRGDAYSTDHGYNNSGVNRNDIGNNQNRHQWGSQWGMNYGASHHSNNERRYQDNQQNRQGNDNYNRNDMMGNDQGWDRSHNNPYQSSNYRGGMSREEGQYHQNQGNQYQENKKENRNEYGSKSYVNQSRSEGRLAENHRGKGPKNYQRSDDRIREDVCDRLADDDMLDASDIEVNVNGSEVVLTGTVLSREAKRHAEDIVESISGVRHVENRIRVGRADELDGNFTTRQIIRAVENPDNDESR